MTDESSIVVCGESAQRMAATFSRFEPLSIARDLVEARALLAHASARGLVVEACWPASSVFGLVSFARELDPRIVAVVVAVEVPSAELVNGAFEVGCALVQAPFQPSHLVAFARMLAAARAPGDDALRRTVHDRARQWGLSPRETELLVHALNGTARETIPAVMGVSGNTLKTQIRALLRKADYNHLDELVADLLRASLAHPAEESPVASSPRPRLAPARLAPACLDPEAGEDRPRHDPERA
jgi:DNA-binding NarL/FixJ family response regulator